MPVFLLAQPVFLPEAPLGGFVGKWTVQHEYLLQTIFVIVCCLAPQGASGLKTWIRTARPGPDPSRPARGEWIEKSTCPGCTLAAMSRPARGEWIEKRRTLSAGRGRRSRPARGEWIENLSLYAAFSVGPWSRPARGEWIENICGLSGATTAWSRPARGEWIEKIFKNDRGERECVSPRKGRVD